MARDAADLLRGLPTRVAALGRWQGRGLAVLCGLLLTAAQPPMALWPLLFAAWPLLLWLLRGADTGRRAFGLGWWAGAGFFLSGLSWIGEAFLVEGGKVWWYLPLMPVAVAALAAFLALFWGAGFFLAHRLGVAGWRGAVALATTMLGVEVARGTVLTGFPWAMQAHAWVETPVIQTVALMGAYALSGLTLLVALLVGTGRMAALGAAVAVAASWGWGALRLVEPVAATGPVIRLVQPNVGQRDKWAPENLQPIFRGLVDLTAAPADTLPALVVWPEVAVTFLFDESPDAIAIATEALPPGAALAVGAVRAEPATPRPRYFNSLQFYDHAGQPLGAYDKRTLTPFGEYVPYAWLLRPLGLGTLGDGLSGFTPGTTPGPFSLPGLPPAAVLICYEIIFPGLTRRTAATAEWIIQVTNDSWFGDSFGPRQHLAQARVRAIETGLPVARAANTGISAMIDPHGRVLARLELGERGVLDAALPARVESTPFARLGDGPPLAILAVLAALCLYRRRPAPL